MNEVLTPLLARLLARSPVEPAEIGAGLGEILEGRASDVQAAGFVVALRTKGETAPELAALVRALQVHATPVTVAPGAIDTCGTGGDRSGTINVSTLAALVAAGAGARVVKHGNRAASSQCGSADVLEALGVTIDIGPERVAACVAEAGMGFCFAPRYHPALRFLAPVRRELAVPTTFNFLGPLANPAAVTRQSLGVSDPEMAERVLGVLAENGAEHALVFCGHDGLDELTVTTTSSVWELRDGDVRCWELDPADLGIPFAEHSDLLGGDAPTNAEAVRAVLDGQPGPKRDIALLNAAAALLVAGLARDLAEGFERAAAAVDGGAAARALDTLVAVSGAPAPEGAE